MLCILPTFWLWSTPGVDHLTKVIHGFCTFEGFDILGLIRDDGAMWRNILKFFGLTAIVILLGIGALSGIQYVRYWNSPEYRAEQDLKNLEKQYAEDPYGGETPEETLRLFIDALKAGDTDLAAKYFVLDKQEQWKEDLAKIQEKGLLGEMVKDLERAKKTKTQESEVFYTATNEENIVSVQLIIGKNPYSQRWKIYEL